MSQRGKRQPNRTDDGPVPAKRRKCRPTQAEEEEAAALAAIWVPRPLNDLKISSIYNRSATEAPAELFRKDLISAMKLPDSEPLSPDEYWVITDQWKQEWERGVQVPVNPDSLPEPTVTVNQCGSSGHKHHEFKLPKTKYIRITKDEFFTSEEHFLSNIPAKADKACSYDLDDCDAAWLQVFNGERACMGLQPVTEDQLERVIEELEIRCWEKVQTIVKTEEGLGIEYDENVICDVCRSPDSEEGNEMVFCDSCNICVHQACYGITTIPSGSWLCRTCAISLRPECVLCPNKGGAMKCTRSGQKWAHVSCALWIPEVSIGCVERMEPITKISSIPQSRWALICVLCRERVGACIQCSVKTCKTAYHVTCAFKHGLEMRAIIEDENADDGVKLRSYCQKHSVTSKKEKSGSASDDDESKRKKRKDMTSEEKNQARAAKLQEIEAEFDKHVSIKDVTQPMDVDPEGIQFIYNYWKLKRKAGFNKPLLPPKSEDVDILSRQQEQADIEKMKMFVQLRQDLERVRNLCYMVSRREKLSRTFFRMREQTFHKQVAVLSDTSCSLKIKEVAAVIEANHGPSIYDRLYSQPSADDHTDDFELVLARIAGIASPTPSAAEDKSKLDLNGLVKCSSEKKAALENPYKRLYFNGATRRRSSLYSMSSGSETDPPTSTNRRLNTDAATAVTSKAASKGASTLRITDSAASSTEDDEKHVREVVRKKPCVKKVSVSDSAKGANRKRSTKMKFIPRVKVDTSSEEEEKPCKNVWQPRSRTLRQMERELGDKMVSGSDDSDELLPIKSAKTEPQKINAIYSDSDSETSLKEEASGGDRNEDKSNIPSDSQQHVLRTKAAVKEFSAGLQPKVDKSPQKNNAKHAKGTKKIKEKDSKLEESVDDDFIKDKENVKSSRKKEYDPTDLIVPQRQAAKKATESIRCSQGRTKEQILFEQEAFKTSPPPLSLPSIPPPPPPPPTPSPVTAPTPPAEEPKIKQKSKHKIRDSKMSRDGKSSDIYDFEKDSSDPQEILAYVPQRQAAKKAAAHIKSGMTKPVQPGEPDAESNKVKKETTEPVKAKKETEAPKSKKESENEKIKSAKSVETKGKSAPKNRMVSSSSSSNSSSGSSSDSVSEEEDKSKSNAKPLKKETKTTTPEKRISSENLSSPQKDNNDTRDRKNKIQEKKGVSRSSGDWPFLDKGEQSVGSSSLSSDSDSDDNNLFKKKGSSALQKSKTELIKSKSGDEKIESLFKPKPKSSDGDDRKGPNSKLAGKKFKKAPDKKLKTSDGRPELEFQPPVIERDESSRAKDKLVRGRKHGSHKASGPSDGNRLRNTEGRSGNIHGPKSREPSPGEVVPRRERNSAGNRNNRSRAQRVEEQPKRTGDRESDSEKRSKKEQKEQSKHETGKRKSSEKFNASSEVCREATRLPGGRETSEESSPRKERGKSNEQVPTTLKKTDKKVVSSSDSKEEEELSKETKKSNLERRSIDGQPAEKKGETLTSRLEREIAQRKAEREPVGKKSSKVSLDKLFEKRDKNIEKLFHPKNISVEGDKSISHKVTDKGLTSRETKKLSLPKDAERRLSVKEDIKETIAKETPLKETIPVKEKSVTSREVTKRVPSKEILIKETLIKETSKDRETAENEERKKDKITGDTPGKEASSKSHKYNSVITSSTEKQLKKDEKDTVIRKVEKQVVSKHNDKDKEVVSKRNENKMSESSNDHQLSEKVIADKESRKASSESRTSVSADGEDDKVKKKVKPMPRCRKAALGFLDTDGSQEEKDTGSKNEPVTTALSTETKLEPIVEPSETVKKDSSNALKDEISVAPVLLPAGEEIKEVVQHEEERSSVPKENTAPVLSPEHLVPETAMEIKPPLEANQSNTNTTSNTGSFTLMPHLEKACALDLGHDFQVPEQEPVEARKITSRSSSLNAPLQQHRSIFSPQQPSKDPGVAELFDFENDILAVDETVNDGFSIPRDPDELLRAPLSFSFNNDFLFKEDSKEDSARETLNLVEKLRLEYAKKSTNSVSQPEAIENVPSVAVQNDNVIHLDEVAEERPTEQPSAVTVIEPSPCIEKEDKPTEVCETKIDIPSSGDCAVENKVLSTPISLPDQSLEPQLHTQEEEPRDKHEVPPYMGGGNVPYDYHSCGVQLDVSKVSIPGREKLDRSNSAQADERWVPPSLDFMQQHRHNLLPHHYESLPPPLDCTPAPSPYTDLRSRAKWADSEVLPVRRSSSSSAASTSSSSSHREEMDSQKHDDLHLPPHTPGGVDISSYQGLHPGISSYSACQLTDGPPYHPYSEASQFVGPVALFPPSACAQLPFPSPGAAMFPPPFGPPFPTPHSVMPPVSKPPDEQPHIPPPCGAAFTSSSHNMAFTAAIVSPPPTVPTQNLLPPVPSPVLHNEPPLTPASFTSAPEPIQQLPIPLSPVTNNRSTINHHQPATPAPPPPPPPESPAPKPAANNVVGKKSPAKPTRASARFISQQNKSPGKSPGKSPRQDAAAGKTGQSRVREASTKRGSSKVSVSRAMYNQPRGGSRRGRGRGRGQHSQHFQDADYPGSNTIHSKLAGTVYELEFDDESPSEGVENLRAMRERRRSTDVHDRKSSDSSFLSRDSSPSPKFISPSHQLQNSKLRTSFSGADIRDLRPPSPLGGLPSSVGDDELMPPPSPVPSTDRMEPFTDVVQPLLPGPVDMRTYSSSYEPNPNNNSAAYHNNLLGTFASDATEQHVTDFDEEMENELHSALVASKAADSHRVSAEAAKPLDDLGSSHITSDMTMTSNNKVSLSDSRNQLKVKIKGPFLDANYAATASTITPLTQQQPTLPVLNPLDALTSSNVIPAATTAVSAAASSGTSNLRRMRKKELLRQYWTQDMNMDDPAGGSVTGQAMAPTTAPPVSRTIITIPKAVASMTSIPTREDYKAVVDANMEKKRRKEKASLSSSLSVSRELRHLDLPMSVDELCAPERRRSVGSTGSNASSTHLLDNINTSPLKRRGRPPKTSAAPPEPIIVLAPKLKIKIGNSIIGPPEIESNIEEKKLRIRPPKKRLTSVQMPSVEELKRESMKFRRRIMADFDEEEKKESKVISGKRRKQRQSDSQHEVELIDDDRSEKISAPKIVIRINKRISGSSSGTNSANCDSAKSAIGEGAVAPTPRTEDATDSRTTAPPPTAGPDASAPSSVDRESRRASVNTPVDNSSSSKSGSAPLNVRTSKVSPIRLKLARCQEGYVMKTQPETMTPVSAAVNLTPNESDEAHNNNSSRSTIPVNKGCEVR